MPLRIAFGTHARDVHEILPFHLARRHDAGGMVDDTRGDRERRADLGDGRFALGFDENGFAMREAHGHTHGRRRDVQARQAEHLARFGRDFFLFARIPELIDRRADERDDVAENRRGKRRFRSGRGHTPGGSNFFLMSERLETGFPRAAHRLIRRDAHAP